MNVDTQGVSVIEITDPSITQNWCYRAPRTNRRLCGRGLC